MIYLVSGTAANTNVPLGGNNDIYSNSDYQLQTNTVQDNMASPSIMSDTSMYPQTIPNNNYIPDNIYSQAGMDGFAADTSMYPQTNGGGFMSDMIFQPSQPDVYISDVSYQTPKLRGDTVYSDWNSLGVFDEAMEYNYDYDYDYSIANADTDLYQNEENADTQEFYQAQDTSYSSYSGSLSEEEAKAFDSKLGSGFSAKLESICSNLGCNPQDMIGLMFSESGLNPDARNKSSNATGLIQFLPSTAQRLGTTVSELKNMSAVDQLDYIEEYYSRTKNAYLPNATELSGGDLYALTWLPGRAEQYVLVESNNAKYYSSGLDAIKDSKGEINKDDLSKRIQNKYNECLDSIVFA